MLRYPHVNIFQVAGFHRERNKIDPGMYNPAVQFGQLFSPGALAAPQSAIRRRDLVDLVVLFEQIHLERHPGGNFDFELQTRL